MYLENANSCEFVAARDVFGLDPQLGPLSDNGGLMPTHALPLGSRAADKGDPAACPAVDQRGCTRPADGDGDGISRCDIGAFEINAQLLDSRLLPLVITTRYG